VNIWQASLELLHIVSQSAGPLMLVTCCLHAAQNNIPQHTTAQGKSAQHLAQRLT
jgi:hypothetical protein